MNATVAVAHDASAEEMKEAVMSLAAESLDGYVGELDVSREVNGAEGLQVYRCGVTTEAKNVQLVSDDYDDYGAGTLRSTIIWSGSRQSYGPKQSRYV